MGTLFSLIYFTNNMRKLEKILLISIIYLIIKVVYFYLSAMYYQDVLAIYYLAKGVIIIKHLIYIVFYCIVIFISFKILSKKNSKTINNTLGNFENIENTESINNTLENVENNENNENTQDI